MLISLFNFLRISLFGRPVNYSIFYICSKLELPMSYILYRETEVNLKPSLPKCIQDSIYQSEDHILCNQAAFQENDTNGWLHLQKAQAENLLHK